MRSIFILLLAILPGLANAQVGSTASTCIWSGTVATCLPSSGIYLPNQRAVRYGEATGSGVNYVAIQAPTTLAGDVTLTLPIDDGDANEFLQTNGSGALSFEPVDLADTDVTGILPLAKGGTNKNATAVNGGLVYSDADSMEITSAGTSQNWVLSGGAGAPTMSNTTTTGKTIDGSADEIQLTVQGNGTQTNGILTAEKSDGTDLLVVTNTTGTDIRGTTTNGLAIDGFVGEKQCAASTASFSQSNPTDATYYDDTNLSLSIGAGQWFLYASGTLLCNWSSGSNSGSATVFSIRTSANAIITSYMGGFCGDPAVYSDGTVDKAFAFAVVNLSGSTTYKVSIGVFSLAGTPVFTSIANRADLFSAAYPASLCAVRMR